MTQKKRDFIRIARYIIRNKNRTVTVEELKLNSGTDTLRVFPILYPLYLCGNLSAMYRSYWETPIEYNYIENNET